MNTFTLPRLTQTTRHLALTLRRTCVGSCKSQSPRWLTANDLEDELRAAPGGKLTTCCGTLGRRNFRSNLKKEQAKNKEKGNKTR
jgi:hypothetical protein